MRAAKLLLSTASLLCLCLPTVAQNADFSLTYHIERTPSARLSIEACGNAVAQAAQQNGHGSSSSADACQGKLVHRWHASADDEDLVSMQRVVHLHDLEFDS
ncbi:DUF6180 family protein, partial [Mesorhizobium sp. SB112]|uniref:DUF6180 family protein n=1 Tax=Mesorhizobium sp. SB112 TaxID=3151853 RepID=UPI0032640943